MNTETIQQLELIKRHSKYNENLVKKVISQSETLTNSKATKESKKLYKMYREVSGEAHRLKGFLRFNLSNHGILYTETTPTHEIEEILIEFFTNRYPKLVIIIQSKRGTFVGTREEGYIITSQEIEELLPILESELPINPLLKDIDNFDENIWNKYYESQYIDERRNLKLFFKTLPRRFQSGHGLEEERSFYLNTRSLEEYI